MSYILLAPSFDISLILSQILEKMISKDVRQMYDIGSESYKRSDFSFCDTKHYKITQPKTKASK